jgi:hypothetical protein
MPGPQPWGAPRQPRPGSRTRRTRRARALTIALLAVATIVAGAWYVLVRGTDHSGTFVRAHDRYVAAARAVPEAANRVQRRLDFPAFDAAFTSSLTRMQAERDVFGRLAHDEEGDGARIAGRAVKIASRGIDAATAFHDALLRSRIDLVVVARKQLDAVISGLNRETRAWDNL